MELTTQEQEIMGNKEYNYFVLTSTNKIVTGWEYRRDAIDYINDSWCNNADAWEGLNVLGRVSTLKAISK